MNDPSAGLQPITNAGTEAINSSYGNIPQVISSQMAKRGYGSSGSMGNTMYQTNLARLGSIGQLQGQMAQLASQRQMQSGSLMDQLLSTQVGSSGTSKTTTSDPSSLFSALGSMAMMLGTGGLSGIGGLSSIGGLSGLSLPALDYSAMAGSGTPVPYTG